MIEELIVDYLIANNLKISFAESCTGGLCAARIVNVANASKVLNESIVTYSDEAKHKYLGVSFDTINKYNVVSEEVAKEMVVGLNKVTNAEICVSVTGMAGPSSDGIIPIGVVCFGFYFKGLIYTDRVDFTNLGRNVVREKAVNYVLNYLVKLFGISNEI